MSKKVYIAGSRQVIPRRGSFTIERCPEHDEYVFSEGIDMVAELWCPECEKIEEQVNRFKFWEAHYSKKERNKIGLLLRERGQVDLAEEIEGLF